jgi:hypothetical protein
VAPEDQDKSTQILVKMARNKVRQMIYDAKIMAISYFYAEKKGERKLKDKIIGEDLAESFEPEDYMTVSKLSCYFMFILNCIICS